MNREIERKFLVFADRIPHAALQEGERIVQGYLSYEPSVRVRTRERGNVTSGYLTVKGPGLIARDEFEYAIPGDDASAMLGLCHATLSKVRHRVRVGEHVWDLDEFMGAHQGLWLAEVELSDAGETFERPAWLDREVTDDPRYTNGALARAGRAP